jgi:hypothetical protein
MVMPQIPVLFLPKGSHGKKTTVVASPVVVEQKKKTIKIAALLKGKMHGHQKNFHETSKQQYRGRKTKHNKQFTQNKTRSS